MMQDGAATEHDAVYETGSLLAIFHQTWGLELLVLFIRVHDPTEGGHGVVLCT